jgi:hypothetical protein
MLNIVQDAAELARRLPTWFSSRHRCGSLSPPGYPGDFPRPAKSAAIQSHYDEDQSMLQGAAMGVR